MCNKCKGEKKYRVIFLNILFDLLGASIAVNRHWTDWSSDGEERQNQPARFQIHPPEILRGISLKTQQNYPCWENESETHNNKCDLLKAEITFFFAAF